MISLEPPPISFATGDYYTAPLHVYWFEPTGQWFLFDHRGFLCRTDDLADVARLVRAEARRHPNLPGRKFYWPKARDEIDPGWSERNEQTMIDHERKLEEYRQTMKTKRQNSRASPTIAGLTGEAILAKLGLVQNNSQQSDDSS